MTLEMTAEDTLTHLSKFISGSQLDVSSAVSADLIKSALLLLQTLPATKQAVLHYVANIYDNAVREYCANLEATENSQTDVVIEDIQAVLLTCIREHPTTWGPVLSKWCLECLGEISSRHTARMVQLKTQTQHMPTPSLNEMVLNWLSCPSTKSLVQITFACFKSLSDDDASSFVDSLINSSVQHSPHFDWIVAHIGSCFPEVIISRVMMCGLSDFSVHCVSDSEVSNVPKLPSVAGILTHLAVQHGGIVRLAMSMLIKDSLSVGTASTLRSNTPAYLLDLAIRSPQLQHSLVDVIVEQVNTDILTNLAVCLSQKKASTNLDSNNLVGLVVHLLMKNDHNTEKILYLLLRYASGGVTCTESTTTSNIPPVVQQYSSVILNRFEVELQRVTNRRCKDLTFDIPFLCSIQSHKCVTHLCQLLATTSHEPSVRWLYRVLSSLALHCGESCAVDIMTEILMTFSETRRLQIFINIQQDVQAKYPDILSSVVSSVVTRLVESCLNGHYSSQTVLNLTQLCQWQLAQQTNPIMRSSIVEVLSRHMDSLAACLSSSCCNSADVLLLLCLLTIPVRVDIGRLTRISTFLVSCFFQSLRSLDTNKKFLTCQRCIKCLGRLSDNNSSTQAGILRQLIEGALSKDFAPLFGGKCSSIRLEGPSYYRLERSTEALTTENQSYDNQPMASGTLLFHSGVIGRGITPSADSEGRQTIDKPSSSDETHNRQLLLEALWTSSCRRLSNRSTSEAVLPQTPSLDTERRFPAEVAKHLAFIVVELVTPDVMFNDITWPDEETMPTTIERDLQICRRFDENPVLWDIMDFLSTGLGAMKYCSCLLRGVMATLIKQWESSREKLATNHPKLLATTCRIIEFLRKGQILPEPLCYTGDILKHVSPYEVYLLLINIWTFIKENAPLPGTRLASGCSSRYTELIHTIFQSNISQLSHLSLLLYPPVNIGTQSS